MQEFEVRDAVHTDELRFAEIVLYTVILINSLSGGVVIGWSSNIHANKW